MAPARWREALLLFAILTLAAFLRLPVDNSGDAGWILERTDENHYLSVAQRFLLGDWQVHEYVNPTFYSHVLHGVARCVGGIRVAVGLDASFADFAAREAVDPHWMILGGRLVSLTASVLTVAVLAVIGRRLFSPAAGWIAAAALAIDRLTAMRAALVGNESLMTLLVAAALLVRVRDLEAPTTRRLALGGFLIGLATSTKYQAGIFLLPMLLFRPFTSRRAAAVLAAALAGFLAGSPGLPFHFAEFRRDFALQQGLLGSGYVERDVARNVLGFDYYVASFPRHHHGLPFAIACALGLVGLAWSALRRRDLRGGLVLASVLPLYLVLGRGIFHYGRFLLPAVPFVLLAGAVAIERASRFVVAQLTRRFESPFAVRVAPILAASIALLLLALGLRLTWSTVTARARAVDPRVAEIEWARALLPARSRCCELAPLFNSLFDRTTSAPHSDAGLAIRAAWDRQRRRFEESGRWRATIPLESFLSDAPSLERLQQRLAEQRVELLLVGLPAQLAWKPLRLPEFTPVPQFRSWRCWPEFFAWIASRPQLGRRSSRPAEGGAFEYVLIDLRG